VQLVETLFLGIKAAVVVIVIEALLRVSKRALSRTDHWFIAALTFIALFFLAVPYPVIVIAAALYGYASSRNAPPSAEPSVKIGATFTTTLATALIWGGIWLGPLLLLSLFSGPGAVLSDIGWFFSKLAVVTFGGAYAVLAYMGQDVVTAYGWLDAGEMMDGLGLAETTPGPLILVTEFVGYLAAYRHGDFGPAWLMGLFGAAVTLWVTFAPCFLWIFVGAPYVDWISGRPRLTGALSGITAAVVGVILNLSLWFALNVLFGQVASKAIGPIRLWVPDFLAFDWRVAALAGVSAVLLFGLHWGVARTLAAAALGGLLLMALGV